MDGTGGLGAVPSQQQEGTGDTSLDAQIAQGFGDLSNIDVIRFV